MFAVLQFQFHLYLAPKNPESNSIACASAFGLASKKFKKNSPEFWVSSEGVPGASVSSSGP